MSKIRGIIRWLRQRLFFVVLILLCFLAIFAIKQLENQLALSTKKKYQKSSISCFKEKIRFYCVGQRKDSCFSHLKEHLISICQRIEKMGFFPFENFIVYVNEFKICTPQIEKHFSCSPSFTRLPGDILDAGYLSLPARIFKNKNVNEILAHEITHVLFSRKSAISIRVVSEFYALYISNFFVSHNLPYFSCEASFWNQPVLASFDGLYYFPPRDNFLPSLLMVDCRYGQLRYIARSLAKRFPHIFILLWRRTAAYRRGPVRVSIFKNLIKEIDRKAFNFIEQFYIFKEAAGVWHLVIIGDRNSPVIIFPYRSANPLKEDFLFGAILKIDILRGRQKINITTRMPGGYAEFPSKYFLTGDILSMKVIAGKKLIASRDIFWQP